MTSAEQFARAKRIFLEASRLPKGERTRFVIAECADDKGLVVQVRRLLDDDPQETGFLETPALPDATAMPEGTRLGRFRVLRLLGEGGMGVVYEAEEDEPRRRVALKVIRSGVLSERLRSRFRHEIRVLGQLRHPGIAQIYEAGTLEAGGDLVPFFAMELIEGLPLLRCAQERSLSVRERLALVAQICDAVHHAHQKGVIHRDLKPGNILVEETASTESPTASGTVVPLQVKVLDFGIARVTDTAAHTVTLRTEPGQLVGTLPYMSPEQVAGQPDALDIRSDVYSIGVIAFELLAGRLPYAVRDRLLPDAVRMIHEAEPTRLGSIDRTLRGDIETIIGKALEKDRQHRYQSAAEMAADIRRFLRDEPIIARPASALYQLRKFARRHKPFVAAALLVFAAMAGATVISTWQARVAFQAKAVAESEKTRANLSAESARREARRATLAAAAAAIGNSDPIAARAYLDGVEEHDRGWPWRYWNAQLDDCVAVIRPPAPVAAACLTAGGEQVRVLTKDGRLAGGRIWDGEPALGPNLPAVPVAAAAFIAGGDRLIAICGRDQRSLDEFDARNGSLVRHIADLPARGALVEASNDGAMIAVALKKRSGTPVADEVWLWDHDAPGRSLRPSGRTSSMALTADGRSLVFGFDAGVVWEAGAPGFRLVGAADRGFLRFAVAPNGSRIATGGEDKSIRIWGRDSAEPSATITGHAGAISALAFDPSGTVLASAGTDLTIRLWDAAAGKPLATLPGHRGRIHDLRYSPDGARLLSISDDQTIRIWQREPAEAASILRGHTSYVYGVAFTPDGSRIVSAGWDQSIRIWDAPGGACLRTIPDAGPGVITALALTADGATIATAHKTGEWDPGQILLWDVDSGRTRETLSFGRGEVHGLVFNRQATRLWTGWERGEVGVADLTASPPAMTVLHPRHATYAVALAPDESRIAIGGAAGWVRILDAATGAVIREWSGHRGIVTAVAWCPTRPLLASASRDGTVRLWDSDTAQLIAKPDRHWDKVYCLAFSPDGNWLASGSEDTTIAIWDAASGEALTQLRGHDGYVYALAFSPDGTRLVSGSGDHTVRVWDTRPLHERWRARMKPAPPP